jgi:thymidylate kinase
MRKKAKLVIFEGCDACGKGTQSRLLVESLARSGVRAIRVEPTKESNQWARKAIYAMLADGRAKQRPHIFQFIQLFNRLWFQWFCLPRLMRENDIVVMDRWALSGYVYGGVEGINPTLNDFMYSMAKKADLTVVLGGSSYKRAASADSYEKDALLQSRVKTQYRVMAHVLENHAFVDNHDPIMDVHDSIMVLLQNKGIIS